MRENVNQWIIPSAVGCGLFLLAVVSFALLVRVKLPPDQTRRTGSAPAMTIASKADADRIRQDLLLDLAPLFLPTHHNASVVKLPPRIRRESGSMAFSIPPALKISESGGGIPFPELIPVPAKPVEVLTLGEGPNPWPEVGRADVEIPQMAPRLAYVEVARAKTGQAVFLESVPRGTDGSPPATDWPPLKFVVAVDPAGLVGAPVITDSTSSEEVETFFRNFLVKKLRLGARLAPGFYTVRIGP